MAAASSLEPRSTAHHADCVVRTLGVADSGLLASPPFLDRADLQHCTPRRSVALWRQSGAQANLDRDRHLAVGMLEHRCSSNRAPNGSCNFSCNPRRLQDRNILACWRRYSAVVGLSQLRAAQGIKLRRVKSGTLYNRAFRLAKKGRSPPGPGLCSPAGARASDERLRFVAGHRADG